MAVRNIKLTIRYDGSDYHGWQVQPGVKTIQDTINKAARELTGLNVNIHGASRTDAGVHALGQVGQIQADIPVPTANLARALTGKLPHDIAISHAEDVPMTFNVGDNVTSKLYRYTINTNSIRPVLEMRYCWHLRKELDIEAMRKAAALLVGKNDFRSFASAADTRTSSVRTIFRCDVERDNDKILVEVEGDGFLYNMVRNIVGTLSEVGTGHRNYNCMTEILEARDRTAAGIIAPPNGLCLVWIKYGDL